MSHDRESARDAEASPFEIQDVMGAVAGVVVLVLAAPAVKAFPSAYGAMGDYLSAVYGISLFLFVILLGSLVFGLVVQALSRK